MRLRRFEWCPTERKSPPARLLRQGASHSQSRHLDRKRLGRLPLVVGESLLGCRQRSVDDSPAVADHLAGACREFLASVVGYSVTVTVLRVLVRVVSEVFGNLTNTEIGWPFAPVTTVVVTKSDPVSALCWPSA